MPRKRTANRSAGAGESLGMLGTILFLVVGLPGILLLPIGLIRWLIGRG